jgi:hypothetical protein
MLKRLSWPSLLRKLLVLVPYVVPAFVAYMATALGYNYGGSSTAGSMILFLLIVAAVLVYFAGIMGRALALGLFLGCAFASLWVPEWHLCLLGIGTCG